MFLGQIQTDTVKVPRPANAFMLYANENRKKMAQQFPLDSNKEISKRLGDSWRGLDLEEKNKYFAYAKIVDAEHKRKYPGLFCSFRYATVFDVDDAAFDTERLQLICTNLLTQTDGVDVGNKQEVIVLGRKLKLA